MELLKSEEPDFEKELGTIHLNTIVTGNKVSLFVTTSNQGWIDLGILASEFFDRILGVNIDLKADVKVGFNFDFEKFFIVFSALC